MSKIGKINIAIPEKVKVALTGDLLNVEGPLGLSESFYDSNCKQIDHCNIRTPIQRINNNMINMFRNMNVQDITN